MKDTHLSFDERLAAALEAAEKEHQCRIGLSFRDDRLGLEYAWRGNELFHPASTMKVPVMIEVFRQAEAGAFKMDDTILVDPMFRSMIDDSEFECDAKEELTKRIGQPETILRLTELMIVVSDNLATNLVLRLVRPPRVTATMRELGARDGFVLRGVQDEKAFQAGISNRLTPNDLTTLMHAIETDQAAGTDSCAEMRRILLDQKYNDMIPAKLPEGTRVAHKTGNITRNFHDAAIVYTPTGSYCLTIMVEGITESKEAKEVSSSLARMVHDGRAALE